MGKSGPLGRAQLVNQIQGFRILDRSDAWENNVYYAVQGGSNFKSVDETLVYGYSKESYWAVLSCRVVYYAVQDGSNVKSMDKIQACDHAAKRYLFRIMPYQHLLALNTDKAYIVCSTLYTKG